MKKAGFLGLSFLTLLIFLKSSAYAQNIITGNQKAETTVTNNVTGGNVTTHIETTVNGKTNVIDSQGNGNIEVKNENGNVTISTSPQVTVTETKNSTPTPKITPKPTHKTSFLSNFFDKISNYFKRIFHNL